MIPRELEDRLVGLRKTDKFCRMSMSEIVRYLVQEGLKNEQTA